MASASATAERYAASQQAIWASVARISKTTGVPIPDPAPKTEANDAKAAYEAERVAQFLARVAATLDGGGITQIAQAGHPEGGIGDGYNHEAAMAAKAKAETAAPPKPPRQPARESSLPTPTTIKPSAK
jgi:hypothetical protein